MCAVPPRVLKRPGTLSIRRHQKQAKTLLIAMAAIDLSVALLWVQPMVFRYGLAIAAGVVIYLGAFPLRQWGGALLKKVVAALLFTAGIFVVSWAGSDHPPGQLALPAAGIFYVMPGESADGGKGQTEKRF